MIRVGVHPRYWLPSDERRTQLQKKQKIQKKWHYGSIGPRPIRKIHCQFFWGGSAHDHHSLGQTQWSPFCPWSLSRSLSEIFWRQSLIENLHRRCLRACKSCKWKVLHFFFRLCLRAGQRGAAVVLKIGESATECSPVAGNLQPLKDNWAAIRIAGWGENIAKCWMSHNFEAAPFALLQGRQWTVWFQNLQNDRKLVGEV